MTVKEAAQKANKEIKGNIKGIYLRSLRNGKIYKKYSDISEIDQEILSQATPGYVESFGRMIIDMY